MGSNQDVGRTSDREEPLVTLTVSPSPLSVEEFMISRDFRGQDH